MVTSRAEENYGSSPVETPTFVVADASGGNFGSFAKSAPAISAPAFLS
ncbi:hypothetical protein DSM3645_03368 [Blastopirellula marina DSM 3645]|uniref:Uncharacterized protein n=1 Tax=Blastopirellula marina DSM 3645 TaxID=314230 RepID=A3ZVY7_9BACT|nr:hypothetical protein DSM3645_03368 [Blastopirellula marina DSM 3645]